MGPESLIILGLAVYRLSLFADDPRLLKKLKKIHESFASAAFASIWIAAAVLALNLCFGGSPIFKFFIVALALSGLTCVLSQLQSRPNFILPLPKPSSPRDSPPKASQWSIRFTARGFCLPLSRKSKASIACHAAILPALVQAGLDCGYAIALHGSLRRDLDIIATPWAAEAVPPKELIEKLARACNGKVIAEPSKHPHGRLSFQIHLGEIMQNPYNTDSYIDISVFVPWEQPVKPDE